MRSTSNWKAGVAAHHAPVWIGMAAIVAMSWLYLARMDGDMSSMGDSSAVQGAMAMAMGGGGSDRLATVFAMWAVMMTAMMLPTVAPSAFMFSSLSARRDAAHSGRATAIYVAAYAACWMLFAAPAAALQWTLTSSSLLDPMAHSTSALLSAAILLSAGAYQFTSLKNACLSKCRSPLGFFMAEWRDGASGALAIGVQHGAYCVACCWALMAVMFVVGAMNLAWMGLLTLLVLGEKVIPPRWRFDRFVGATLVASGLWIAAGAWLGT